MLFLSRMLYTCGYLVKKEYYKLMLMVQDARKFGYLSTHRLITV